ncbi:hypothetical protein B0H13DRAFT_2660759 [Mycena leptocephala]|nr:hypothetical protein B0H13DRAFT_2660759 [Mycena leptocephala]
MRSVIDDGALVPALDRQVYEQVRHRLAPLCQSNRILRMADGRLIPSIGTWTGIVDVDGLTREGTFEVFDSGGAWAVLFGKPLLEAFEAVHDYKADVLWLPPRSIPENWKCIHNQFLQASADTGELVGLTTDIKQRTKFRGEGQVDQSKMKETTSIPSSPAVDIKQHERTKFRGVCARPPRTIPPFFTHVTKVTLRDVPINDALLLQPPPSAFPTFLTPLNAKHQPSIHSVSRGLSNLLLSQYCTEPRTPELATYDMARPPPFTCCDGYGLTLGIVGFWTRRAPARDIGRSSIPHIRIASAPPSEIGTILSARTAAVDARTPASLKLNTTLGDLPAPYTGVDPLAHAYPAMHMAQRRDRGYWCVVYCHLVPFHQRSLIFAHSFPSFSSPRACIDHPPKQDEQAALAPFTLWPMYTMRGILPHRTTPSLRLLPTHDIALFLSSRSFPHRPSPHKSRPSHAILDARTAFLDAYCSRPTHPFLSPP